MRVHVFSQYVSAARCVSGPDMGGVMGMFASLFVGKRNPDQPVQQLEDQVPAPPKLPEFWY